MPASIPLTTLAFCRDQLGLKDTEQDANLGRFIDYVSADLERRAHRRFLRDTYTQELYDGNGRLTLVLRQGPIVGATLTLEEKPHGADDTEFDVIDADDYEINHANIHGAGRITRVDYKAFMQGTANYRVTYDAGFATDTKDLPPDLVMTATNYVCALFNRREWHGLINAVVGEAAETTLVPDVNLQAAIDNGIADYRLDGFA